MFYMIARIKPKGEEETKINMYTCINCRYKAISTLTIHAAKNEIK